MKKLLIFWIPIVALILATIDGFRSIPWMFEELGLIENLTVIFLLGAIVLLAIHAARCFKSLRPLDKMVLLVLVAGSVYFAGEELSWGQHWGEVALGFETERGRWEGNYQNEMNFHNRDGLLGKLLDDVPRALITLGIAIGGIIFPFFKQKLPYWMARYVPGRDVLLTSVLAVFVSVPNKLLKYVIEGKSKFDSGEMKEFYIALFILLFSLHFIRVSQSESAADLVKDSPEEG